MQNASPRCEKLARLRAEVIDESSYAAVVEASPSSTVYHTPRFLAVLKSILEDSRLVLLGVFQGGDLLGAIPCMLKESDAGSVLNCLPFRGSIGGCLFVAGEERATLQAKETLLEGVFDLAKNNRCVSSTVISSPLEDDGYYRSAMEPDYVVDRVAQVLELPDKPEDLMQSFNKKSRNSVRRARAEGVEVSWDSNEESLRDLGRGHRKIMLALGSTPSPTSYFKAIADHFSPGEGYRVYKAIRHGETVGLLLALYHAGRSVEYLVPVVLPEHRKYSPMNVIIYEAASDAVRAGFKSFSFGGTRPGQVELHRFKESFGARDRPYHYFTKAHGGLEKVVALGEKRITSKFRWFFVAPFSKPSA